LGHAKKLLKWSAASCFAFNNLKSCTEDRSSQWIKRQWKYINSFLALFDLSY